METRFRALVSRALINGKDYTIWGQLNAEERVLLVSARRDKQIVCQCGKPLTYVDATQRIPHFRHLKGNCSIIGAERDTISHNEGLEYLGQLLRTRFMDATVEKEHMFKARKGLRRTDVYVKFKNGRKVCCELQLSPVQISEFRERTSFYKRSGNDVVWIFGPDASGIRNIQTDPKGAVGPIKEAAFLFLRRQDFLFLYFPETPASQRLWTAHSTDHNYDRAFEFLMGGFLVAMHEVKLTMNPLRFADNGLPLGLGKKKHRSRFRKHQRRKRFAYGAHTCIVCRDLITTQHYHRCNTCNRIVCDSCTMRIEEALGARQHDIVGKVRHCDWRAKRERLS